MRAPEEGGGGTPPAERTSWAGTHPSPEFPTGLTWFNVEQPLTISELRGKMVLLDFWTLGCINCQHIIPDLKRLEDEFGDSLVVVGVHSGKYSTEHDDESIREAVARYGLEHPVVNDPDFAVWQTFGASAWPTVVLIDPAGNLVGGHAGEGIYPLFQPILASLKVEFADRLSTEPVPIRLEARTASTVLSFPAKVLADPEHNRLFIADGGHNRILVSDVDGRLQQAIGDGQEGFADGEAFEARFRQPQGLALSPDGSTLYVADTRNHAIRAMDVASGKVTTIAGTGQQAERFPVAGAEARETALVSPWDVVAIDHRLFVTMAGVHQLWVMDVDAGTIEVFAGTSREGIDDGPRLTSATLAQPSGIATDGRYLWWVDPESSSLRRVVIEGDGEVETVVGTGLFDYGNEDGRGKQAKLQHAQGVAYADGKLYVGDTYNHELRAVDAATFDVDTVAGTGARGWKDGPGDIALLDEPGGVSVAGDRVFIADTNNHLVRVYDTTTRQLSTLTLTNVGVATASGPANVLKLDLAGQSVAPGASNLRLTITTPAGYHLNSQGPSKLTLVSSNPQVAELGEREITWQTDDATLDVPIPVNLAAGATTLSGSATVYYCRTGGEALCFVQQVEVSVPITVDGTASASEPRVALALPEVP